MSVLPRFVPPAGTVLRASEVLGWLGDAATPGGELERLRAAIEQRYGVRHVFLASSASAGMTVLLRVLAERSGRKEAAVPGYTCYSVAASAVRAGLSVRPVDVLPSTIDIAPAALAAADLGAAAALVATSLYGIPADLPRLEAAARDAGTPFIDDAAQCLDAKVAGRWVGTFGDAGLFSFDKGKNITSIQGGVILCRDDDLAERIARACDALPAAPAASVMTMAAKMLAYFVLLRPRLYWIANKLVPLGDTPFVLDSPMTRYSGRLAPIVRRQVARLEDITAGRAANAQRLQAALDGAPGLLLPSKGRPEGVYPRFPIVFEDAARRERTLRSLVDAGIGATGSYPRALRDVPDIKPHLAPGTADTPGARAVATGILTLPTHAYVTGRDIDLIARIVRAG